MDNFLDKYVNRVLPHAVSIGHKSEAYAQRVIARLDAIAEATSRDDPDEYTITRRLIVTAGSPADMFTVPPGQTYRLQGFAIHQVVPANPTAAFLYADGQFVIGAGVGVNGFTAAAPNGFIIRGGAVVTVQAQADTVEVSAQFTVERRKPVQYSHIAGNMEWEPYDGVPDPRQEAQESSRHSTPGLFPGTNVNGSRSA